MSAAIALRTALAFTLAEACATALATADACAVAEALAVAVAAPDNVAATLACAIVRADTRLVSPLGDKRLAPVADMVCARALTVAAIFCNWGCDTLSGGSDAAKRKLALNDADALGNMNPSPIAAACKRMANMAFALAEALALAVAEADAVADADAVAEARAAAEAAAVALAVGRRNAVPGKNRF